MNQVDVKSARLAAWGFPAALLLVAALVLWRNFAVPGITSDSTIIMQVARNLLMGQGLGWQALWIPPGHSLLVAAVAWLSGESDLLRAATILGGVEYLLLVLVVYAFAASLFSRRVALVAGLLSAVFPHLVFLAGYPEAEITYTLFQVMALWLLSLTVQRQSWWLALLAGLVSAAAYLARSEGLIVLVLVVGCLVAAQGRDFWRAKVSRLCLLTLLVCLLASAPYLFFLRQGYGAWVVSPKTSYVLIWMKGRIYHDHDLGEIGNPELWGLSPAGKLCWQEPKGIADLLGYLAGDPGKSLRVYLHNLGKELPGRIPNNSGMERYPQVFPVYLALLAVAGALLGWPRRLPGERALLLAPFLVLLILPVFTEGWWRYQVAYLPLLLILAAQGGWQLLDRLVARGIAERAAAILMALAVAALAGYFLAARCQPHGGAPTVSSEVSARRNLAGIQRHAGEWAVARFGPGRNYQAPWSKLVYHLQGSWTAMPVAPLPQAAWYGRLHGAELLVLEVDPTGLSDAQLAAQVPFLSLVGVYRAPDFPYGALFFALR